MDIKKIILGIGCTLISVNLFSIEAKYDQYDQDKRIFGSLTDVWFVRLIGKKGRIEDLQQLSALMINRLLYAIRGLGLSEELNKGHIIELKIKPYLMKAVGKINLYAATRYAVYEFEKMIDFKRPKGIEEAVKQIVQIRDPERKRSFLMERKIILAEALPKFNTYYRRVIQALEKLGASTEFPKEMTIESIKKLGEERTARGS